MNDWATWAGAMAVRLTLAIALGAAPAWGLALVTNANPWGLWLVSGWVHLVWLTRSEGGQR